MTLKLPSGWSVEVKQQSDWTLLILAANSKIEDAKADRKELVRMAKATKSWPVAEKEEPK